MRANKSIKLAVIITLALLAGVTQAQPDTKTAPFAEGSFSFASDVIQDLAAMEDMRARTERDIAESKAAGRALWADIIRNNTRAEIDIRARISRLGNHYDLQPFAAELPEITTKLYTAKLETMTEMTRLCSLLVEGVKPEDYWKIAAYMPTLTGRASEIDHAIFQSYVVVFGALLDMNRPQHLIITSKQRDSLIRSITTGFGEEKLSQTKDQNYIVGAGSMLRDALMKVKSVEEN